MYVPETRPHQSLARKLVGLCLAACFALGVIALSAGTATADGLPGIAHSHFDSQWWGWGHHHPRPPRTQVCTGTPEAPGTLAGVYPGNVFVEGVCAVNAGEAVVPGNLIVRPGSALIAAFALDDESGSGSSSLSVGGNLIVQSGAAALLGCEAEHFACLDDPTPEAPTLSSQDRISGNLIEQAPLGVVAHDDIVSGSVIEVGGGGGLTCEPSGIFAAFGSPVYSDYEDNSVGGNIDIVGLQSCWLGVIREHVGGSVHMIGNQLADPDAIEIISNEIAGNLLCLHNSQTWNSADETENIYPRAPGPNTVAGKRFGQCVLASPATEGGTPGPGPF